MLGRTGLSCIVDGESIPCLAPLAHEYGDGVFGSGMRLWLVAVTRAMVFVNLHVGVEFHLNLAVAICVFSRAAVRMYRSLFRCVAPSIYSMVGSRDKTMATTKEEASSMFARVVTERAQLAHSDLCCLFDTLCDFSACFPAGSCTKRISGVEGPAWQADVHVCDEIVSINGVFVSGRDFSGFDVVELCKKAARTDPRVQIAVRDFCTQDVRTATIDMTERSPMYSFLQEHKGETNGSRRARKHSLGSIGGFVAGSLSASFESETTPMRTPSARDLHFVDDSVYESPLRNGEDSTGRGGWTWRDPGGRTRAVFFFIATVLVCAAWTSWVLSDEVGFGPALRSRSTARKQSRHLNPIPLDP